MLHILLLYYALYCNMYCIMYYEYMLCEILTQLMLEHDMWLEHKYVLILFSIG